MRQKPGVCREVVSSCERKKRGSRTINNTDRPAACRAGPPSMAEREREPKWWTGLLKRAGKRDCPFSLPQSKTKQRERESERHGRRERKKLLLHLLRWRERERKGRLSLPCNLQEPSRGALCPASVLRLLRDSYLFRCCCFPCKGPAAPLERHIQ